MNKKIKFGTDGWRAIIGRDFNLNNVTAVAQAIADYLIRNSKFEIRNSKVVVGYDTRKLSRQAAQCISQVLAANEIRVVLTHRPLPSQAVSFAVRALKCTAGIMVTASHNPARFNGIKIKGAFGGPVEIKVTKKIEAQVFQQRPKKISLQKAKKSGRLKIEDLIAGYLKFLRSYLNLGLLKRGHLKVLVDPMHGTANSYIEGILKNTPNRVTTIHKDFDASFGGIKPEPIAACLRETAQLMRRERFDICLVTDGDADRIAALDNRGEFINPQQIISLLLLYLIRKRKLKGAVVKTIAGTALLERIAKRYRLKVYETPVGFKHISGLMQKKDILIGGEEAGGIGFKKYIPERDGILAGLLLLEMMIDQGKSLAALLQEVENEFARFVYLRKDLKCTPNQRPKVRKRLTRMRRQRSFCGIAIAKIKDYDGLKFCLNDSSWILFRLSGTEPILRIYAESGSATKTRRLIAEGAKILKNG
jgi:alpha-D-glucose phosphate-specific phosphoglucomutase